MPFIISSTSIGDNIPYPGRINRTNRGADSLKIILVGAARLVATVMAATSPEASIRLAESKVSSCLKPTASWDAAKGVWVGDAAMGEEPPRPLVVFGYGSLCWRPDTTLGDFDSFPCILRGWTRLFCQRSTDHRGTPEAPGLVVTLCETPTLAVLPGFESETVPDRVLGRADPLRSGRDLLTIFSLYSPFLFSMFLSLFEVSPPHRG